MLICLSCGNGFSSQSRAWGDETSGECIAERVELMLSGLMPTRTRLPMRRAVELCEGVDEPVRLGNEGLQKVVSGR